MDQIVNDLVQFIRTVPPESFFVVYLVSALWVALESLGIGLPIEPLLLLLGAAVSQRHLNPILGIAFAALAGMVGAGAGALAGYGVGWRAGPAIVRVGRFVGLTQTRVEHMELWLRQRGARGIFAARFVPVLRGLAPYVIGASQEPVAPFLLGTLTGALGYNMIWIALGFTLGYNYQDALDFFNRFGLLGLAAVIAVILILWGAGWLWSRVVWRHISAHFHRHQAQVAAKSSTMS